MNPLVMERTDMETRLSDHVAGNIRAEMARKRVSQKDLADSVGLCQTQVSKRLSGKIPWPLNDLPAVADALGVSLERIIFGYEKTPTEMAGVFGGGSPNWTRTSNPSVNSFPSSEGVDFILAA